MAGILTQAHFKRLEALRRTRHVLQGEDEEIVLLKRDSTNTLVELLPVEEAWAYGDRAADGSRLPPSVMFELQIAEELISVTQMSQIAAVKHGTHVFQIVAIAPGEPGIFKPSALQRFWRFWLAPLEGT